MLFSALLPGERLKRASCRGRVDRAAGTVLLFVGRGGISFAQDYLPGFAAAFVAAFTWAIYSVLSRRFAAGADRCGRGLLPRHRGARGDLPRRCSSRHALAADAAQWLAVLALGIGPVGAAFYAWDIGMKRGDIRVLGVASYRGAAALDRLPGARRLCDRERFARARRAADRGRRDLIAAKDMIFAPKKELSLAGRPILRRHLEARELKSRRHRAADQRPVAQTLRRLPLARRHHRLRTLAGREIGPELDAPRPVPARASAISSTSGAPAW